MANPPASDRTEGSEGAEDRVNPEDIDGPRPMVSMGPRILAFPVPDSVLRERFQGRVFPRPVDLHQAMEHPETLEPLQREAVQAFSEWLGVQRPQTPQNPDNPDNPPRPEDNAPVLGATLQAVLEAAAVSAQEHGMTEPRTAAQRQRLPGLLIDAGRNVAENWARDAARSIRMRYQQQINMDSDEEGREEDREDREVDLPPVWGYEDDSDEEVIPDSLDTHALAQPRPPPPPTTVTGTQPLSLIHALAQPRPPPPPTTVTGTQPLSIAHDHSPPSALHELVCLFIDRSENDDKTNKDKRPHNEFLCPLSLHAMREPVCCDDGCLYERTHIEQALLVSSLSPINRKGMTGVMVPCKPMITMMENWVRTKLPPLAEGTTLESVLRITLDVPEEPEDKAKLCSDVD